MFSFMLIWKKMFNKLSMWRWFETCRPSDIAVIWETFPAAGVLFVVALNNCWYAILF